MTKLFTTSTAKKSTNFLLTHLQQLVIHLIAVKSAADWIIQSYHFIIVEQLPGSSEDERKHIEYKINLIYKWFVYSGNYYRCTVLGIYALSSWAVTPALNCYWRWFTRKKWAESLAESSVYTFLYHTEANFCRLSKMLDRIIMQVIDSNANHVRDLIQAHQVLNGQSNGKQTLRFARQYPSRSFNAANKLSRRRLGSMTLMRCQDLIKTAHRQHEHLIGLLDNKRPVWSSNRNMRWHKEVTTSGARFYMITCFSIWCLLNGCWLYALTIVSTDMQEKNDSLTKLDRFFFFGDTIMIYNICHWVAGPLSLLHVTIRDKGKFLDELICRFQQILANIHRSNVVNEEPIIGGHPPVIQDGSLDSDTIDLYIKYRLFEREMSLCRRLTSLLLHNYLLVISIPILSVIPFLRANYSVPLVLVCMIAVSETIRANIAFGSFAAFHSKCIRMNRLAWSLVAQTSDAHHISQLINPHTSILWRRAIRDEKLLTNSCTIKILGLRDVTFRTIIAIDFWVISLVLLCITRPW